MYRDVAAENAELLPPTFAACKSMMHRSRREDAPPLPTTVEEIDMDKDRGRTLQGEPFVLFKDNTMLIFCTDANLRLLASSEVMFIDGTFKSVPSLFHQLFTIHAVFLEHFVTLVYCLLPDKQRATYHKVFDILKTKLAEIDLILSPDTMSDFESGLIACIRHQFPNSQHKGCLFHHTQSIWRHVQMVGLQMQYNEDPEVKKFVRMLMAIAFLPVTVVRPAFISLRTSMICRQNPALDQLADYYERTWFGQFPAAMWNVHNSNIRTNRVEAWNSKLNKAMGGHFHPNVYQLSDFLRKEQSHTEATVERARRGEAPPRRKPKYVRLDETLGRLKRRYQEGALTSHEFLSAVRHLVHQF